VINSKDFLSQEVEVVIDRPLGSKHPEHGFIYEVNYGYVPNTESADGEELDAYYLGIDKPIEKATGICIAIVHRTNDNDDKLVVVPEGMDISDEEIEKLVEFQEKWFKHIILRKQI
jgi:inorganic pyrophosphatase